MKKLNAILGLGLALLALAAPCLAAGEVQATAPTGKTLYAEVLNQSGQVWQNANTFAAVTNTSLIAQTIPMTEQGTTGIYLGNFPVGITTPGTYLTLVYIRAGASAAAGDTLTGSGGLDWTGTALASVAVVQGNTVTLGTGQTNLLNGQGVLTTQTSSAARMADMINALTSQGYTVARAAKLDNADVATSTRSVYAGGAVASVTAPVILPVTAPATYGYAGLTTTDINAVRDAIFNFPLFADSPMTFRIAAGDTWAASAGPSTATYPDATHQNTVYQTPAGAGQHSTGLTTNTAGKPISRTVTHP